MGFQRWFKEGVGLAGKHLMNVANASTGGLAGKLVNGGLNAASKNAGLIGKGLNWIGHKVLNDRAREKLSNFADEALEYIPSGKVKKVLSKINNAAQERGVRSVTRERPRKVNLQLTSDQLQKRKDRRKSRRDDRRNVVSDYAELFDENDNT